MTSTKYRENRRKRRGEYAKARLVVKRRAKIHSLSYSLAFQASVQEFSRNEARRRLVAEVKRVWGSEQLKRLDPRLISVDELKTFLQA